MTSTTTSRSDLLPLMFYWLDRLTRTSALVYDPETMNSADAKALDALETASYIVKTDTITLAYKITDAGRGAYDDHRKRITSS
jgi:hypothetical protein